MNDPSIHHGESLPDHFTRLVVAPGEGSKSLETVATLLRRLMELEADRDVLILGFGGGVVTDLAGFVASIFLRGVEFGFVATTLLAQVDAAMGGKNGVNLDGYKNIVGTITQPKFVISDPAFIRTLPRREVMCGLSEAVKSALVGDRELFRRMEDRAAAILRGDPEELAAVVDGCVSVKTRIVELDEHESGPRRLLNLGHTLGHALEREVGLSHGEAVSVGIGFAARLSVKKGLLDPESASGAERLLEKLGLPLSVTGDGKALLENIRKDKKRQDGRIGFVLLEEIGKAVVVPLELDEIGEAIDDLR